MANRYIVSRRLPERARLQFVFPKPQQEIFVVTMPFYENPQIRESKRARYSDHRLMSRSSNLYTYTGADSRKFDLSFNMTLDHITIDHPEVNKQAFIENAKLDSQYTERDKFFNPVTDKRGSDTTALSYVNTFFKTEEAKNEALQVLRNLMPFGLGKNGKGKDYIAALYGIDQKSIDDGDKAAIQAAQLLSKITGDQVVAKTIGDPNSIRDDINIGRVSDPNSASPIFQKGKGLLGDQEQAYKVIDVLMYWINIIRTSVINSAENPTLGPPVVRLTHGMMYQDVPCVCKDYSIEVDEKAGYDLETLFPRRLRIRLKLEEFRSGDFGKFERFNSRNKKIVARDNLAGWEAMFGNDSGSMDPGRLV